MHKPGEEGNHKIWKIQKNESASNVLDRNISIKISPRKIIKGAGVIVVLLLVFYLGRWSVGDSLIDNSASPAEEESGSFSLSGFATGILSGSPSSEKEAEANDTGASAEEAAEPAANKLSAAAVVSKTNQEEATASEEPEEKIITSYSKIALSINGVKKEWKGTWGKITGLDYTIKNNEVGTIKPDHFIMGVEGYEDVDKKVGIPPGSKSIKTKVSVTSTAMVPSGFAYNAVTAGDLSNVEINATLYDANDEVMGTFRGAFDLRS